MRAARVFRNVTNVPIEMSFASIRVRAGGISLVLLSIAASVVLILFVNEMLGLITGVVGMILSIAYILYMNRLDPDGTISEWAQISAIRDGLKHSQIVMDDSEQ